MPVSISAFSSDVPDQKLSSAIFSSRRGPIRGVPSVATGSEEGEVVEDDIGLTPKVGGKGRSDTSGFRTAQCARNRNRTTGTPRPRTCMLSRQVSWLTGQRCCPAFPKPLRASVTLLDSGSPLTVAGAAPALAFLRPHRLPS